MSVASQRIAHPYRGHKVGMSTRGPRSVIGAGFDVDQASYLLPNHHQHHQFSAMKSEGVKLNMPDDWGENTTVITSEQSFRLAMPEKALLSPRKSYARRRSCVGACSTCFLTFISLFMVFSGAAMVILPVIFVHLDFYETKEIQCELECTTNNFVIVMFTVILAFAVWGTKRPMNSMLPRVRTRRLGFLFLIVFILASFWLFYIVQALLRSTVEYSVIQTLAKTLLSVLILLQVLWVVYGNVKSSQKFIVTIVRDPDGELHQFQASQNSIQELAIEVLAYHETNFTFFNVAADKARTGAGQKNVAMPTTGFKLYDIDGNGDRSLDEDTIKKLVEVAAKQSAVLSGDYCAEEGDRERKLKRKKYRLLLSAEEAFTQIASINQNVTREDIIGIEPSKAAKVVSGAIGKHLHRFLRNTYQQTLFPAEEVMRHLEFCFRYGFSARAFLSQFFNKKRPYSELLGESRWTIVSERIVTQQLEDGIEFILRCQDDRAGNIQLHCTVNSYPFYNLTEAPFRRR